LEKGLVLFKPLKICKEIFMLRVYPIQRPVYFCGADTPSQRVSVGMFGMEAFKKTMSVLFAVIPEYLDPGRIQTVCDFGSGLGDSLLALRSQLPRWKYTVLEQDPIWARQLVKRRILPPEQVLGGDGIAHLASGEHHYDLITAFNLGPDDIAWVEDQWCSFPCYGLARRLLAAAPKSLNPGGKLLITFDDSQTPVAVKRVCDELGLRTDWIAYPGNRYPGPIAVISFDKT
jgi:hypothetical protein